MQKRSGAARWWRVGAFALLAAVALGACGDEPQPGPEGGAATGWLVVVNHTAKDVEVFFDGARLGEVAAGATETFEGDLDGEHELHALATDSSASWGPVRVKIDKGYTHTWNLWE